MDTVNAIAKARFASVRPQRVHLQSDGALNAEMLCMEPGQNVTVGDGQWVYYVIVGKATVQSGQDTHELDTGHLAISAVGERHILTNTSETRLICLAVQCVD